MRRKISELTYIVERQKGEIRMYRRRINTIGLVKHIFLHRSDEVLECLVRSVERGSVDSLEVVESEEEVDLYIVRGIDWYQYITQL